MRGREFHYRWEYELQSGPEALWPFIADTNRFNHDTGLPTITQLPVDDAPSSVPRRRLRLTRFGMPVEWEEEPFEWIRPFRFGVMRRFRTGPVETMRVAAELTPQTAGGTWLVYEVWAQPKSRLGRVAIPLQLGLISAREFGAAFRRYDEMAARGQPSFNAQTSPRFATSGHARLALIQEKLITQGASPKLVVQLAETIKQADDLTLARLRPYVLADFWQESRREVLELCLWATRFGLLDLRWDLLCPLCRGASNTSASLAEIDPNVHCESCHIDFTVNFDRSVELTFRPNAAIRSIEAREFCVGGPQVTPHIVAQQMLAPSNERTINPVLEAGRYRLRTSKQAGALYLLADINGATDAIFTLAENAWPNDELRVSTTPTLHFINETADEQLFILERMAWSDQAATAAEVTALQVFRDLFANEALRPQQQISVGQMTILFTDLCGSTRLYREIGDAPAFGAVMNHFDILRQVIAEEEGALVKTLGDAVMAVFRRPASALRAILRAQQQLAAPADPQTRPLQLKAGIHSGPCIAVTLNERLDYFGSNVNIAARLEPLSTGRDVIISDAVRNDPRVAAMLDAPESQLRLEPLGAMLKGFDAEQFELWRVTQGETLEIAKPHIQL